MRNVIQQWVQNRGLGGVFRHKAVRHILYYEVYDFMAEEGYYTLNVVYSETKILGSIGTMGMLRLQGDVLEEELTPEEALENMVVFCGPTLDDWREKKSQVLEHKDFVMFVDSYMDRVQSQLLEISTENAGVVSVARISDRMPILLVELLVGEQLQPPIVLTIGEPSLVRTRVQDNYDEEYRELVLSLGELTGGIIWH